MTTEMTAHERKNTQLIALFDQIVRKRPDLLKETPSGASMVMQIDGEGGWGSGGSKFNLRR